MRKQTALAILRYAYARIGTDAAKTGTDAHQAREDFDALASVLQGMVGDDAANVDAVRRERNAGLTMLTRISNLIEQTK